MDGNRHGILIKSMYKHGAMKKAFDNERMAIPDLKWIGIHPDDEVPKVQGLKKEINFSKGDTDLCERFLKKQWVKDNSQLKNHIKLMLRKKVKYQFEHFIDSDYLTNVYLPSKLELGKWV